MIKISLQDIKTKKQFTADQKVRVKAPTSQEFLEVQKLIRDKNLNTVCEQAACPNIAECWKKKHATFMILGNICTRRCRFCNVKSGKPLEVNENEPYSISESVKILNLRHVVITSVDRDDLPDGGAGHFANVIRQIRADNPNTTIEVLTPDFLNKDNAVDKIIAERPNVYNHNLETVRRLFPGIKIAAKYDNSLRLLKYVKESDISIFTKSGLIVGMGERNEEVLESMQDLRNAKVEFITIGQYLKPKDTDPRYIEIDRMVNLEDFAFFKQKALEIGFLMVSSSPLTRSSYHADEDFEKLLLRS